MADQVKFCVLALYYNKEINCVSGSLNLKTVFLKAKTPQCESSHHACEQCMLPKCYCVKDS